MPATETVAVSTVGLVAAWGVPDPWEFAEVALPQAATPSPAAKLSASTT
jgi:hypothetical protein